MHGVKRSRISAQAKEERKAKEAAKLKGYLTLEDQFFDARDRNELSEASLELTGRLLSTNPEHYTAWNFRREVIAALVVQAAKQAASGSSAPANEAKKDFFAAARIQDDSTGGAAELSASSQASRWLLDADLELTEHALRSHPKVYWIWNHRKWCLEQYPIDDAATSGAEAVGSTSAVPPTARKWQMELKLVDKMLELDGRNFHGWDYRRYLLSRLGAAQAGHDASIPPPFPETLSEALIEAELAYALRKIEKDFSNFSAWHQRQLLLQRLWHTRAESEMADAKGKQEADLDREFELIQQAMYTDPSDQSVWQYHRWLLEQDPNAETLDRELAAVEELLEVEPDAQWCILALVHYRAMRRKLVEPSQKQTPPENEIKLLQRLIQLDPDRRRRYEDEIACRTAAVA